MSIEKDMSIDRSSLQKGRTIPNLLRKTLDPGGSGSFGKLSGKKAKKDKHTQDRGLIDTRDLKSRT